MNNEKSTKTSKKEFTLKSLISSPQTIEHFKKFNLKQNIQFIKKHNKQFNQQLKVLKQKLITQIPQSIKHHFNKKNYFKYTRLSQSNQVNMKFSKRRSSMEDIRLIGYIYKSFSYYSINNSKGKQNQDVVFWLQQQGIQIYGVCDGHGVNGYKAANLAAMKLPRILLKNIKNIRNVMIKQEVKKVIQQSFKQISLYFQKEKYLHSGTTTCLILIMNKLIFSVNLGDSRSFLIKINKEIKILTHDHKPFQILEKKRIENSGGKVSRFKQKGRFFGPMRIWNPNNNHIGLAVSRSLGDTEACNIGIISQPQIDVKYIVIGSDGLYDFTKQQQLSNECMTNELIKDKCKNMCLKAKYNWQKYNNDYNDDITCLLIQF